MSSAKIRLVFTNINEGDKLAVPTSQRGLIGQLRDHKTSEFDGTNIPDLFEDQEPNRTTRQTLQFLMSSPPLICTRHNQ